MNDKGSFRLRPTLRQLSKEQVERFYHSALRIGRGGDEAMTLEGRREQEDNRYGGSCGRRAERFAGETFSA